MRIEGHLEEGADKDRRGSQRNRLRLRLTVPVAHGSPANVLVRDISETGVLLETSAALAYDQSIEIELPRLGRRAARIAWSSGEFFGCRFEEPIGAAAVSAARLQAEPAPPSQRVTGEQESADSFGGRLRRLRQQHKLSQTALATLLNVSKMSIWKWERGDVRPRRKAIEALAQLFAVSEAELLLGLKAREAVAGEASEAEGDRFAELVEDCKSRIAGHLGTTADRVAITVSL